MHQLPPDFKTLAAFRKEHPHALQGVCRELTVLCKTLELCGRALSAMDGSTCKAVKSQARNFTEQKWQNRLKQLHEQIDTSLQELDAQATLAASTTQPTTPVWPETIEPLRTQPGGYQELLETRHQREATQISLPAPESRSMNTTHGLDVCYHGQLAVENKYTLIVDHEVTNAVTALAPLAPMAQRAQDTLATAQREGVAERG